jgi:hypothetical protein
MLWNGRFGNRPDSRFPEVSQEIQELIKRQPFSRNKDIAASKEKLLWPSLAIKGSLAEFQS